MGTVAPISRPSEGPITRDDLEAKMRELVEGAQGEVSSAKSTFVTIGVVVGVVLLLITFLLGRRGGKKRRTIVEIRRV
jgi:hypothetical protein